MELTDLNKLDELTSSIQEEKEREKNPHVELVKELFGPENVVHFPGAYLIPQLGALKWDGHIYISGATGAGKSYLIRQIIENDLSTRKVYLFSNVKDDPSFKGLTLHNWENTEAKLDDIEEDAIYIFDDYPDRTLRDMILETGRHKNAMAVVVNHKHREWRQTMKPLNEAKYVILFPSANKGTAMVEMHNLGMDKKQRNAIVNLAQRQGRYMILHQHAPNAIITQETVVRL